MLNTAFQRTTSFHIFRVEDAACVVVLDNAAVLIQLG
jgi:hypothetical protein